MDKTTEETRSKISEILETELSETVTTKLESIFTAFAEGVKKLQDNAYGEFTTDLLPYVVPDVAQNLLNCIRSEMSYDYIKKGLFNGQELRTTMLKENYEQIIKDLDQDNLARIEELKNTINFIKRH